MKRRIMLLSLVLALAMLAGLFAGCGHAPVEQPAQSSASPGGSAAPQTPAPTSVPDTYTYNRAVSVFPTVWNVHTMQTQADAEIAELITPGFYALDYNDSLDGFRLVPCMASGEPVDVTADYIGAYGLEEGAEQQAWLIPLRSDLKWQDGTPITAYDFVDSAMRLEDPAARNFRADMLYSSELVVTGIRDYLYQGQPIIVENTFVEGNSYRFTYGLEDLVPDEAGGYRTPEGDPVFLAVDYPLDSWLGGDGLLACVELYGDAYFDLSTWADLLSHMDERGLVPLTDDTLALFLPVTTGNPEWGESEADLPGYLVYTPVCPEQSWEDVGLFALNDTELVLVLEEPLSGFYLLYALTSSWLVNTGLYDRCISEENGVYTNLYGTSAETTMSCGPYMLAEFQADKRYRLVRNPYYFGYNDADSGRMEYQTTDIVVDYIPEDATRLEAFLQGQLDEYLLAVDDMETYSRSDACYYTPGDATCLMVFNPDYAALLTMQEAAGENVNKTILTIPEFRRAMSYALDRAGFCLATAPTNSPAFGLYSSLIVSDPEQGIAYRSTEQAKQVLANFWGVADDIGDGKLYADIDEAVASLTGYDPAGARDLFNAAYDLAVAAGYMDEDDVVEICIGLPTATSSYYNNGYEFLVGNYTEAVRGTRLEGKLRFTRDDTLGNGYYDAIRTNQVDLLFGVGWTGSPLNPYSLMEAYISDNYRFDPSWDTAAIPMTVSIHGEALTTPVLTWYEILNGETRGVAAEDGTLRDYACGIAEGDPEARLDILAALENAVLMNYDSIPMSDDCRAELKGRQVRFFTEEAVFGMDYGGFRYLTYDYTDAEWDAYVASCGGRLSYN